VKKKKFQNTIILFKNTTDVTSGPKYFFLVVPVNARRSTLENWAQIHDFMAWQTLKLCGIAFLTLDTGNDVTSGRLWFFLVVPETTRLSTFANRVQVHSFTGCQTPKLCGIAFSAPVTKNDVTSGREHYFFVVPVNTRRSTLENWAQIDAFMAWQTLKLCGIAFLTLDTENDVTSGRLWFFLVVPVNTRLSTFANRIQIHSFMGCQTRKLCGIAFSSPVTKNDVTSGREHFNLSKNNPDYM
jgi:hypothetical protein